MTLAMFMLILLSILVGGVLAGAPWYAWLGGSCAAAPCRSALAGERLARLSQRAIRQQAGSYKANACWALATHHWLCGSPLFYEVLLPLPRHGGGG